jgi:hypothetical protein
MDQTNFEKFRQIVFDRPDLQEQLCGLQDADLFITRVIELGVGFELVFTADDVREAMNAGRRTWIERWI